MRLEQRVWEKIRSQGKAKATADAYWHWIRRFLLYARDRRGEWVAPENMGRRQVEIFLSHLANKENVSASTQNQALAALCYLYNVVLEVPLQGVSAMRAKAPQRVRDVLDQSEVVKLLNELEGVAWLAAAMMYGSGFRIGEVGRLRMKDISFERRQIVVRGGKGEKDRVVGFPECLHDAVRNQLELMRIQWERDVQMNRPGVSLPKAFGRKSPGSRLDFAWWYLFAADHYSRDPVSGNMYRHHRSMGHVGRQIKEACRRAGITKRITSHCLRHSFATHSLEENVPIHVLQSLMGHVNIETTETYLHVRKDAASSSKSPLMELMRNPSLAKQHRASKQESLKVYAG